MKRYILLLAAVLLLLCGCAKNDTLYLYILPADSVQDNMSDGEIASLAASEGRLAMTGDDFSGVVWESQLFELKKDAVPSVGTTSAESGGSALLKTTDSDVFVWVLGGKTVYVGGFARGQSNADSVRVPYIEDSGRYTFVLKTDDRYGDDKRFNKRLYRYFHDAGLLKSEIVQ